MKAAVYADFRLITIVEFYGFRFMARAWKTFTRTRKGVHNLEEKEAPAAEDPGEG